MRASPSVKVLSKLQTARMGNEGHVRGSRVKPRGSLKRQRGACSLVSIGEMVNGLNLMDIDKDIDIIHIFGYIYMYVSG